MFKSHRIFSLATVAMIRAFDPGKAGWKMSADGKSIEIKDGNPIWIDANGGERTLNGDTITTLNGEAKTLRERAERAESALAPYQGLDPKGAKDAIEMLKKIDQKKLIDAGEVDRVKQEIAGQFTAQLGEKDKALNTLQSNYEGLLVDNIFSGSEFVRDRVAVPSDMFQATFRQQFKVKEGKIEAYDKSGNRIMSKERVGEYATPDEALQIIVDQHPQKATILKASGHSGSGNNGQGGQNGGGRTIRRADFDALNPMQQAQTAASANKGEVTIVD